MPNVNPDILKWARETAGLSPENAVNKLGIRSAYGREPVERLAALENGETAPTRPLLVKMSKQYRRPLLSFYLSAPPRIGDRGEDFRTFPASFSRTDNALVDAVVRDIRVRQALLRTALEEEDEAKSLAFIGKARTDEEPSAIADQIKTTLSFDITAYRKSHPIHKAVSYLRNRVESAGIFVLFVDNLGSHHTEIPVDLFRGLAIADEIAPFIAVNANDSGGAQAFTIVHELVHLWLGLTGVSGRFDERQIEKFCNDVAGEFLLPTEELAQLSVNEEAELTKAIQRISAFADARKVSKTMVAYKLHRSDAFSYEFYESIARTFRRNFLNQRSQNRRLASQTDGGPTYPVIRGHRAGPALVELVGRMLGVGALTTTKAGKVLGVSAKNVQSVLKAGGSRVSV